MSFQLDRGLFQFDFTDRHAILGVGVNAEEIDIRERYQTVARALHPDSGRWKTDAERELAVRLFSRLVTHAYGKLSKPSQLQEQMIMLELLGKRLVEESSKVQIIDPLCQQLYQSGIDFELVYNRLLSQLAAQQFTDLAQSEQLINQISELNMVYLLRKQLQSVTSAPPVAATAGATSGGIKDNTTSDLNKPSPVEGALRRAEDYMSRKNWTKAVPELRDALSVEPNNVRAHTLLGLAYLHQQQTTMAKLSINKAIQLAPKDPQVMQAKQEFERVSKVGSGAAKGNAGVKKPEGMFGGLFGGKK
jgi:tetratricopeptide (TPR) repeat protein